MFHEVAIIVRVDPVKGCQLKRCDGAPGREAVTDFRLVKAVDRLRERIVVTITDGTNSRLDADSRKLGSTFDRYILHPT
jgi:hypothetical protein